MLLAEDHPMNQFLAKTILKQWGIVPTVARTGLEALQWAKENPFDLVLMDVQMPEMDGKQALSALRQEGITTPTIAMTANALPDERRDLLKDGFDDYLAKPYQERELYEVIVKHLREKESAAQKEPRATVYYDRTFLLQQFDGNKQTLKGLKKLFVQTSGALLQELETSEQPAEVLHKL